MSIDFKMRADAIQVSVAGSTTPQFGAGYRVNAYPPGGIVKTASSGLTTITLYEYQGLNFADGDKVLIMTPGTDYSTVDPVFLTITSKDSDELDCTPTTFSTSVGDMVVNLGSGETGDGPPNYDGAPIAIFPNPRGTAVITDAMVIADSVGSYRYWHIQGEIWEVIRDTSLRPIAVVPAASSGTVYATWINATQWIVLPGYATGAEPVTPYEGSEIWNTTTKRPNYWNGSDWVKADGTAET